MMQLDDALDAQRAFVREARETKLRALLVRWQKAAFDMRETGQEEAGDALMACALDLYDVLTGA